MLRPFVGNPQLPVRVVRADAFEGSFFEAVLDITVARMGPLGPVVLFMAIGVVVVAVLVSLDAPVEEHALEPTRLRLRRRGSDRWIDIPLVAISGLARVQEGVQIRWRDAEAFEEPMAVIRTRGDDGSALYQALAWACRDAGQPFAYRATR